MNKFTMEYPEQITSSYEYNKDKSGKYYVIKKEWLRHDTFEVITEKEYIKQLNKFEKLKQQVLGKQEV